MKFAFALRTNPAVKVARDVPRRRSVPLREPGIEHIALLLCRRGMGIRLGIPSTGANHPPSPNHGERLASSARMKKPISATMAMASKPSINIDARLTTKAEVRRQRGKAETAETGNRSHP